MPKARKKPIEIEYAHFTGDNWDEMLNFCGTRVVDPGSDYGVPNFGHADDWIVDHERDDDIVGAVYDYLHQSWIGVKVGDYIIKGTKGEFYPHDGDLFWKNYDPVEDLDEVKDFIGEFERRQMDGFKGFNTYNDHPPLT